MVREHLHGQTVAFLKGISFKTILKERVPTNGVTAANILVTGRTTRCMVTENSHGRTGAHTRATIRKTKKKVTEYISGRMAESMTANGSMASSMVLETTLLPKETPRKEDGLKESAQNGLTDQPFLKHD